MISLLRAKLRLRCMQTQTNELLKLTEMKMPFGNGGARPHRSSLPEDYVLWFYGQGFPPGELGQLLGFLYEIKVTALNIF